MGDVGANKIKSGQLRERRPKGRAQAAHLSAGSCSRKLIDAKINSCLVRSCFYYENNDIDAIIRAGYSILFMTALAGREGVSAALWSRSYPPVTVNLSRQIELQNGAGRHTTLIIGFTLPFRHCYNPIPAIIDF